MLWNIRGQYAWTNTAKKFTDTYNNMATIYGTQYSARAFPSSIRWKQPLPPASPSDHHHTAVVTDNLTLKGALQLPHAPHTDALSDLPLLRFKGLRSQNSCGAHLRWHCRVTHYSGGSGGFLVATWTHTKGLWVTLPVWCRGPVIWRWVGGHR